MTVSRWAFLALAVPVAASAAPPADVPDGGCYVGPYALQMDPGGNSFFEPNETVVMAPTYQNTCTFPMPAGVGTISNFTGPAGAAYAITDSTANYGTIPMFGRVSCLDNGDCYGLRIDAAARPATHWDTSVVELVGAVGAISWRLHVGASFTDVLPSSGFYRFVETILHKNVTSGCGGGFYCPAAPTTRAQMAVFVLVAKQPAGYVPPPCGATPMFADVPVSSPFCPWVEELARRGVTSGCATGLYCPAASVTRDQMAVFVLRTFNPAFNPPACGTPLFADVPASSPFCPWVEELARRGAVTGCGGGNYCPTTSVTREQMAVFLTATFGLTLY